MVKELVLARKVTTFRHVLVVALTGGIGAGKSSASALLVERGAHLVDADATNKEIQRSDGVAFPGMVDLFGPEAVGSDGELDRAAIAARVFADKELLGQLNALMWPLIGQAIGNKINAHADTDHVVLLDIPLLGASGNTYETKGTIVIDCPIDVALDRLVTQRGMDRSDAERRIAAQMSRADRIALADFVIDNSGTAADLARAVDECWAWIATLGDDAAS